LDAKEEAIIKPPSTGGASDTVRVDSVKHGEQQVERDVKGGDYRGKLRPPQCEQPLINVSPLPAPSVDFNKLNLTSVDGNAIVLPFRYLLFHLISRTKTIAM
jgi:hypothetical protein